MSAVRGWWELFPHRWQAEQAALTAAGWEWSVEDSRTERGVLGVLVSYPLPEKYRPLIALAPSGGRHSGVDESRVRLRVWYPASYPFFPPSVRDVDARLRLDRHREPLAGKLCLLQPEDWDLATTAAALLAQQMPRLLAAATSTVPPPAGSELPAAEPLGRYIPDRVGARVLVDSGWLIPPQATQGSLVVGFTSLADGDLGTGLVRLLTVEGQPVETFPDRLTQQFPVTTLGRWLRWDGLTPEMTAHRAWRDVEPLLQPLRIRAQGGPPLHAEPDVEVIGLLVPSEVGYRRRGEEWFFLVRQRCNPEPSGQTAGPGSGESPVDHADESPGNDPGGGPGGGWRNRLFHSAAAGAADVRSRAPATAGLADRGVLLVGVGALGGTVARELARAGIGLLDLLDGDVCDPATSCRQHAPAYLAGFTKISVLAHQLAETNPHTQVRAHCATLGVVQLTPDNEPDPHHQVAGLVGQADLVIDAAANPAVSRYLAALAVARHTPFLHVSATAGGYGGVVAAFPPTPESGCWWCMLHHRHHGTLPFPPEAPPETGTVVPLGCAEPTFTGTSADLTTVATHAARVAIDRLTHPSEEQAMRGDLYVAALRDHHDRPIPARWRTRRIPVHPDCPMRTHQPPAAEAPPRHDRGGAATAQPPTDGTVSTAAGAPVSRKAATARTLRTQQRTHTPTENGRAGAGPEPGPERR